MTQIWWPSIQKGRGKKVRLKPYRALLLLMSIEPLCLNGMAFSKRAYVARPLPSHTCPHVRVFVQLIIDSKLVFGSSH
jgi:hypothetical protein